MRSQIGAERLCADILHGAGTLCLMFAFLDIGAAVTFVLSAVVHECAHLTVMRGFGVPIGSVSLYSGGAILHGSFEQVGYRSEFLCAAAGPFSNLLLALLFRRIPAAVGINLLLCIYNLLPLRGNDGAVMLRCIGMRCGTGRTWMHIAGGLQGICYGACVMVGAWVFWYGALADPHGMSVGYGFLYFCLLARCFEKKGLTNSCDLCYHKEKRKQEDPSL